MFFHLQKWPEAFTASDHRLLVAHFEIDPDQLSNDDTSNHVTEENVRTHQNKERLCSVL